MIETAGTRLGCQTRPVTYGDLLPPCHSAARDRRPFVHTWRRMRRVAIMFPSARTLLELGSTMTRRRAWPRALGSAHGLCTVMSLGCGRGPAPLPPTPGAPLTAADSFDVTFETTKGTVVVRAHRAWSPHGVVRFYELVRRDFYDGVPAYRGGSL